MTAGSGPQSVQFQFVRPPNRIYTFDAQLIHVDSARIVLRHQAHPSQSFHYGGEEVMADGYDVIWFLFQDQPWDVGRFYRPDGTWTGFYVDILEPVSWQGEMVPSLRPIVDLFLDIWIAPDGSYVVLDEDEFTEAMLSGMISRQQSEFARETLATLTQSLQQNQFPPPDVRDFRL